MDPMNIATRNYSLDLHDPASPAPAPTPGEGAGQADVLEDDADAAGMEALADQLEAAGTIGPGEDKRTAGRRWVETSFALFPVVVARLRLGAKTVRDGAAALRRGEGDARTISRLNAALDGMTEARHRFCHAINEVARLFWGDNKQCYDPGATVRKATQVVAELAEWRRRAEAAEEALSSFTTPRPIAELHEDDSEVMAAKWDGDTLAYWEATSLMSLDFVESEYTHFYPLPKIQPPIAAPAAGAAREGERREEVRGG